MLVLHDSDTLLHNTVELLGSKVIPALESPDRIKTILASLSQSHHIIRHIESPFRSGSDLRSLLNLIQENHGEDYLEHLKGAFDQWRKAGLIEQQESILPECFAFFNKAGPFPKPPKDIYARAGFFAFDMSSGIMEETYASVIASANLAKQAVQKLTKGSENEVLALCRPPGHHCDGHRAGGYCYVNNAAVAISEWRSHTPGSRIAILDIDFHHGNGTQEIFYDDANVFYTSIHGEDEFPYYTGRSDEVGRGEAVGTNLNLPLAAGSSFAEYLEKLDIALSALSRFESQLLLVSLGFDTFCLDPLGSFKIDTDDYGVLAQKVRQAFPKVPALILLEGGYHLDTLAENLLSFLREWESRA